MKIELLEEVSSTNDYIKKYLDGGENVIVCARRQSGGKGTKGRSFLSGEGGVYLSALTFYENLPSNEAFRIMTHAAVAVCRTVQRFGVSPEIKWANDVLAGGKKLCGILIENMLSGKNVRASIVGIGVNVANDVSAIKDIATSLTELCSVPLTAAEVRTALIENYLKESTFEEYLSFLKFLGKEILVRENDREFTTVARRILPDGRLEIEEGGALRALSAAEISIRI